MNAFQRPFAGLGGGGASGHTPGEEALKNIAAFFFVALPIDTVRKSVAWP
jgi:hypothetical protein